jgi:ribosomal protein L16 Arg81 hydroxylase
MDKRPRFDVARSLSPLGLDDFLHEYWQRAPLHIERNELDFHADLFSLSDLDALMVQSRMTSRDFRVASKKTGLAHDALLSTNRPNSQRNRGPNLAGLHEAFLDGQSVIVELRRLWPEVDRLTRSFEQTFERGASAELYLTPPNAQAFDVHYDLADVFLFQLGGSKTWHVYDPVAEAPSPARSENRDCASLVGEPKWVFEVRAGDLLYMPYGFPHQGLTSNESSLHITFGVKRLHVHDLFKAMLDLAAHENAALRRPLKGGFADLRSGELRTELGACLDLLHSGPLIEQAIDKLEDAFFSNLDQVPAGQFAEIDQLARIGLDTRLEHHPDQLCRVRSDRESASLNFVGGGVSGPAWLEPALRWIASSTTFAPTDIPGDMSGDSRLILVRRLVKGGLLKRSGSGAHGAA